MMFGDLIQTVRERFGHSDPSDVSDARDAVRQVANRTTELNENLEPYLASDDPLSALMFDLQIRRDKIARGE